jgi:hypothetical protein
MQIVSVSGAVDEEQVFATTALNRRDPIVLWKVWYSGGIQLIAGKSANSTSNFSH